MKKARKPSYKVLVNWHVNDPHDAYDGMNSMVVSEVVDSKTAKSDAVEYVLKRDPKRVVDRVRCRKVRRP